MSTSELIHGSWGSAMRFVSSPFSDLSLTLNDPLTRVSACVFSQTLSLHQYWPNALCRRFKARRGDALVGLTSVLSAFPRMLRHH